MGGMDGATTPTNEVVGHTFTADYVAMKYDKRGQRQPFLHRGMRAMKVAEEDTLTLDHQRFFEANSRTNVTDDRLINLASQQSCYVIVNVTNNREEEKKAAVKKNMFLVYPTPHLSTEGIFFSADHFSFMINPGDDRGKRLHFHRTDYQPMNIRPERGFAPHILSHMPLEFKTRDVQCLAPDMQPYSSLVWSICERSDSTTHRMPAMSGGARRRRRPQPPVQEFRDLWTQAPIHAITVLGIWNAMSARYDVTVILKNRMRSQVGRPRQAFITHLSREAMLDEQKVQEAVAKCVSGWSWENFQA